MLALGRKRTWTALGIVCVASLLYAQAAFSGNVACGNGVAPTKQMSISGENYEPYCWPCIAALRTYARTPVIDTVTAAFEAMKAAHPSTKFMNAEFGFPDGDQFKPHKTHREGLSIDIMVPLKDGKLITANLTNRFGYDVEFDKNGKGADGEIDFNALGDFIAALDNQAKARGGKTRRIYFAPDLQPELRAASPQIFDRISFNTKQAWVRHDEHIHIDFEFACQSGS